jgi:hypothetical protein
MAGFLAALASAAEPVDIHLCGVHNWPIPLTS